MLVALLVCLIPTTIGALLSAIGIAGMDRLVQRNVLAMSGARSRPRATSRRCSSTRPARSPTATAWPRSSSRSGGVDERTLAAVVLLSRLADETPEGRSIVTLAEDALRARRGRHADAELVPFTAQTRMSRDRVARPFDPQGCGRRRRTLGRRAGRAGAGRHDSGSSKRIANDGGTPLVVAEGNRRARRDPPQGHGEDRGSPSASKRCARSASAR